MFLLGLCIGIIVSITGAMMWGHQLSIKEDELNQGLPRKIYGNPRTEIL